MKDKQCNCSAVSNLQFCDEQPSKTDSNDVVVITDVTSITSDDQILIIRKIDETTQVYKALLSEISPTLALSLVTKATQLMPNTDPKDGHSLWMDQGFMRIASNPTENQTD